MFAMAVRIAQRMGIHSEASLQKHSPFEAEMRRRLWWSLALFDARVSEKADYRNTILNPTWDCRVPLNISDSELRPETKEPLAVEGRCTEVIFTVVRGELYNHQRHAEYYLDFASPALKAVARAARGDSQVSEDDALIMLEKVMDDKYLKFADPSNPVHFITTWITRIFVARAGLIRYLSRAANAGPLGVTENERDQALCDAIRVLDSDTVLMESPLAKGYQWYLYFYFQLPSYLLIAKLLSERPTSVHMARAWESMNQNFVSRYKFRDPVEVAPFMIVFKPLFLSWDRCEAAILQPGQEKGSIPPPKLLGIIGRILAANPQKGRRHTESQSQSPPNGGMMMTPPGSTTLDPSTLPAQFDNLNFTPPHDPFHGLGPLFGVHGSPDKIMQDLDMNLYNIDWTGM